MKKSSRVIHFFIPGSTEEASIS